MYCSGCGQAMESGQNFCPRCGRSAAPTAPPVLNPQSQLDIYGKKIRALSILWFACGALILAETIVDLIASYPTSASPLHPREFRLFVMFLDVLQVSLAVPPLVAGWCLIGRSGTGRIAAIFIAFLGLAKLAAQLIPRVLWDPSRSPEPTPLPILSTLLTAAAAICTLVILKGLRNDLLYQQLNGSFTSPPHTGHGVG